MKSWEKDSPERGGTRRRIEAKESGKRVENEDEAEEEVKVKSFAPKGTQRTE